MDSYTARRFIRHHKKLRDSSQRDKEEEDRWFAITVRLSLVAVIFYFSARRLPHLFASNFYFNSITLLLVDPSSSLVHTRWWNRLRVKQSLLLRYINGVYFVLFRTRIQFFHIVRGLTPDLIQLVQWLFLFVLFMGSALLHYPKHILVYI